MQRSIMACYAVRPAARFALVPPRAGAPRLGLNRHGRFSMNADRPTMLRRPQLGPVALLRADCHEATSAHPHPSTSGFAELRAPVRWANLGVRPAGHRPRAATAPWRG
jgi:hypothetical protein